MEEEKKKRKNNRKKKNKQQQGSKGAAEDDAPNGVTERDSVANGNHEGGGFDVERDKASDDCIDACSAAEDEKQSILQERGNLEKSIKQLQCEIDLISGEKASLESRIMKLESERESWLIKEASLEEKICRFSGEKALLSAEQGNLMETIEQLKGEKESWVSNENAAREVIRKMEADIRKFHLQVSELEELKNHSVQENIALKDHLSKLQTQIQQLEKNASIVRTMDLEAKGTLDQKIRQLSDEKTALVVKQEVLEKRIQQWEGECRYWISNVVEIEESKNNAIEENGRRKEHITALLERIKELEGSSSTAIASEEQTNHSLEHENLNSQIEAACALVEKLITENADLVEKVNDLYLELDRRTTATGLLIPPAPEYSIQVVENKRFQDEQPKSYEITPAKVETILQDREVLQDPPDSFKTGEIVQIPLDDTEAQIPETQETDPSSAVPLSDAPLVGAPFRLMSFMAWYVSGADLVDKAKA
ncbi:hypothetical protein MLD38_038353 [Melastoma candidum]|uniref:Uncharacterized protein n=1 Tax=Melastoma candidum TaxID=119954 RepID=A0ACB9L051_9MYRT|nr:hypothetical protein MLD38_038353 [Melastoma candidum]